MSMLHGVDRPTTSRAVSTAGTCCTESARLRQRPWPRSGTRRGRAVEGLDVDAFRRVAVGVDVDGPRAREPAPVPQRPCGRLGPVVLLRHPCSVTSSSITVTRSSAPLERLASMARIPRVNSSTTGLLAGLVVPRPFVAPQATGPLGVRGPAVVVGLLPTPARWVRRRVVETAWRRKEPHLKSGSSAPGRRSAGTEPSPSGGTEVDAGRALVSRSGATNTPGTSIAGRNSDC